MRNKIFFLTVVVVVMSIFAVTTALAGSPDSPGAPAATNSYSLEDLYQRLTAGTAGTQSVFTEPGSAPGTGTMHSINEIMAVAPVLDNTNGATTTNVLAGQTFWGLTSSQWATQTGTMPNNGAGSTIVPTTTNQSVAAGYWSSANTVEGDADLVAGNIAQGVNLFGVDGSGILASGNATPGQVLNGITYSNSSGAATGTMPNNGAGSTIVPTTTNQSVASGYWSSANTVEGDSDLVAGNIAQGVNLFGVDGTLSTAPCDCSGGTLNGTRWCDNGDGTVTDLLGHNGVGQCLVWAQNASWGGLKPWRNSSTDCLPPDYTCFDDAHTRASAYGEETENWRLPTRAEFYALTHGTEPVLLDTPWAFIDVQVWPYWSSTSDADPYRAWYAFPGTGLAAAQVKYAELYVWPVRSGQ